MKIIICGDFCQKLRVNNFITEHKFDVLFDSVRPVIQSGDYSIVNFEFPIVFDCTTPSPISKIGPNLRGSIDAVEAVKYAGFNCCTLANNHILDQGQECAIKTKEHLEKDGIDTVGFGNNLDEASRILYKIVGSEKLAIINCCESEFSIATKSSAGANPLNIISIYNLIQDAKKTSDYILVIVHGGHEMYQLPSPRMKTTYRFFIDAGATAVVNHHQHCFSGYEVYKGHPIFYGLGNFLFDHKKYKNDIWNYGYICELNFSKNLIGYNIHPYSQCCCDQISISVLDTKSMSIFIDRISELNRVISDDLELENAFMRMAERESRRSISVLGPYNDLFRRLCVRRILPLFLSRDRALRIQNQLSCESHYDIFLHSIQTYNSK